MLCINNTKPMFKNAQIMHEKKQSAVSNLLRHSSSVQDIAALIYVFFLANSILMKNQGSRFEAAVFTTFSPLFILYLCLYIKTLVLYSLYIVVFICYYNLFYVFVFFALFLFDLL